MGELRSSSIQVAICTHSVIHMGWSVAHVLCSLWRGKRSSWLQDSITQILCVPLVSIVLAALREFLGVGRLPGAFCCCVYRPRVSGFAGMLLRTATSPVGTSPASCIFWAAVFLSTASFFARERVSEVMPLLLASLQCIQQTPCCRW